MVPTEKTTKKEKTDELDFPINQALLAEATQIKEQWKVIKERIEKIEEHKEKVSQPVYGRVLEDYKERLGQITEQVLEKKNAIDRELVTLYETQKKIASELETHRHALEEIKFRNVLGEFSEEEYQKNAKQEQDKISKFETVLSAINTNVSRYEELFREEVDILSMEERKMGEEISETSAPQEEPSSPSSEQDYFSTAPDVTSPGEDEVPEFSETVKAKRPAKGPEGAARIVIISGDDAGATYPLKDSITFGRAETNTVILRDAKVSRQHAKIIEKGGEYIILDMNSSNGTFVNGERVEEHVLSNNDEFQIGDTVMQFQI